MRLLQGEFGDGDTILVDAGEDGVWSSGRQSERRRLRVGAVLTGALIVANLAAFLFELSLGGDSWTRSFGAGGWCPRTSSSRCVEPTDRRPGSRC